MFAGANHHAELINAGKRTGAEVNDGYLTAYEVASLDFEGTECVSLTSCETGLADIDNVEMLGLRSAFKYAGAQTVLVSLWKLPVGPATRESLDFYSAWMSGRPKADAHRAALLRQLERSRAEYGSSHPVLWAGTVLVGNPQ